MPSSAESLPLQPSDDRAQPARPLLAVIEEAIEAQHDLELRLRSRLQLNPTDFRALLLIHRRRRRGIRIHPRDLTSTLGVSSGATAQIIGRLMRAGLLSRSEDPDDARAGLLELTGTAHAKLDEATAAVRGDLDALIEGLDPEEQRRLVTLLDQARDIFHVHRDAV